MKVDKQSQAAQEQHNRKQSVWTREKINQLVELYKKHECLWNHWHDSYKSKDKRNRAIGEICTTLRISKFDFGKKIHNLRNQFNTEMKKLEQRMEEAGGSIEDASATTLRCKWSHFESLMFLRRVIEPRPGGYQTTFQGPKKMRLKYDYSSGEEDINVTSVLPSSNGQRSHRVASLNHEEVSQYPYEDNINEDVITEDFQTFENEVADVTQTSREEIYDQKYQPPQQLSLQNGNHEVTAARNLITSNTIHKANITAAQQILTQSAPCASAHTADMININDDATPVIELNPNNITVVSSNPHIISSSSSATTSSPVIASVSSNSSSNRPASVLRDQWDAFGELVANEFRNLNSDVSRKRLKRKIMHAMLEVGEEDDTIIARSN